jgi:hypothetical protein
MLSPLPRHSDWASSLLIRPVVSAFPDRVVGSACASTFSRFARRSLTLRPAHSRCHQFVTRITEGFRHFVPPWLLRLLPAGAFAGRGLHPLESAAFSRRTPIAVLRGLRAHVRLLHRTGQLCAQRARLVRARREGLRTDCRDATGIAIAYVRLDTLATAERTVELPSVCPLHIAKLRDWRRAL